MNELYSLGEGLLSLRLFLHAVTVWSVVSFMSEKRTKLIPTLLAIGIAGSSTALFFQGATDFHQLSKSAEPWLLIYAFCMTAICVLNGGNVAKPLPAVLKRLKP